MFQTKLVEKIKTHFSSKTSFENRALCKMTWKNMVRRMRIVCYIPKATNILSEYVILTAFPMQ